MFSAERAGIRFIGGDRLYLITFLVFAIPFASSVIYYVADESYFIGKKLGIYFVSLLPIIASESEFGNKSDEVINIVSATWGSIMFLQLPLFIFWQKEVVKFYKNNVAQLTIPDIAPSTLKAVLLQQRLVAAIFPLSALFCLYVGAFHSDDLVHGKYVRYIVISIFSIFCLSVGVLAATRFFIITHYKNL